MENELIKILYIDDEKAALFNFKQLFQDDFEVYTALSAAKAMEILDATDIQIIVSDQRMPDKTGIEFFAEVAQLYPDTLRILLTAYSEAADIIDAINRGQVYQYITKPFETLNVKNILDKATQHWRLKKENELLIAQLQNKNEKYEAINEELRQTNEELSVSNKNTEESKNQTKEILQTAMDGFWVVDLNGKFIDVNEVACKMVGYTRKEMLKLGIFDLEIVETAEQTQKHIQKIIKIGEDRFESKHYCKNGQFIDVELSVKFQPVQNLIVVFVRDITERKLAEAKLKESEEKYRMLYDSNQMPIAIFDVDTLNFLSVNNAWVDKYGYTKEEFSTMTILEIRPESESEKVKQSVVKIDIGLENVGVYLHKKKNGEIFHVEIIRYDLVFEGKNAKLVFANDITERKKEEQEKNNHLKFSNALNEISEIIIESDIEEYILQNVNRIIGKTLELDRTLIYDISYKDNHIVGLCEWLKEKHDNIAVTKGQYSSLEMFKEAFDEIQKTKRHLESHYNAINQNFIINGSYKILHEQLHIKSLIWYPFAFYNDGYYLFAMNQIINDRQWTFNDLQFLEAVAKQVTLALMKIRFIEEKRKKNIELSIAKEKAEASEERFTLAMKASSDGLFDWNLETNEIYYAPAWKKMLGYEDHELPNDFSVWETTTDPEDVKKSWEQQQKLISREIDRFMLEFKMKHKEGHWVDILSRAEAIFNDEGKAIRIVGTHTDITVRKQAEEALHESENSVRKKLNAILLPEGKLEILGLEEILNIPAVSEIMENIFKITGIAVALGDLKGNALVSFGWQDVCTQYHRAHPVTFKNCTECDTILASQVEPGTFKLYKCKNNMWDLALPIHVGSRHVGSIFVGQFFFMDEVPELDIFKAQAKQFGFNNDEYLLALERVPRVSRETVNALANFYTQFSSMISSLSYSSIRFARIVNEQKQTEDKIKQLNKELEQRVFESADQLKIANQSRQSLLSVLEDQRLADREIQKLNAELEQRVKTRTALLEAANKELETFTYSVSHDLKAPLRGIDGYSKLLLDIYSKDLNEEAKAFISTIRSSTMQMNQLIEDLLDYSRLERSNLSNEKVKLIALIDSITTSYKNDLSNGNFVMKLDIPDVELITDEKGLIIVLRNILENAIKFTKEKSNPTIEIGFTDQPASWIIHVKDNGIGFDMKYHQRIFEIFQRLHRAEDYAGTGIGLAMVSKGMQRMNGKVWAESIPGEGSTFYLEIPKL